MEKKEKKQIPGHVGIIMDGNRRWARERNLPTIEGHSKAYSKMKLCGEWFFEKGVKVLSFYAFSTENWQRSRPEVNYLMKLLKQAMKDDLEEFNIKGIKIIVSGRIDELPGDLPEVCLDAMDRTKANTKGIVNVCINYGGRSEIVDAIKKIVKQGIGEEQVHEGIVKKYLYQSGLDDPDIIVRTSGEQRLSGFLLWQSAYSELLFLNKYWPDFEQADVEIILEEYNKRKRRMGGDS